MPTLETISFKYQTVPVVLLPDDAIMSHHHCCRIRPPTTRPCLHEVERVDTVLLVGDESVSNDDHGEEDELEPSDVCQAPTRRDA